MPLTRDAEHVLLKCPLHDKDRATMLLKVCQALAQADLAVDDVVGWTPSLRGPEMHSLGATPFRGFAPYPSELDRPGGAL